MDRSNTKASLGAKRAATERPTSEYVADGRRMVRKPLAWMVLFASLFALVACGGGDSQERHRVSGRITYAGQPVNFGEVLFTPDATRGNAGAQGIAVITNGRYDTEGSRAPGVAAGPVVVRVTALADANGKLLCEHEFSLEVSKGGLERDIEIPADAGKGKSGVGQPGNVPATPEI